ncbi:MAG: nitrate/nitrite transporter, partial [Thiohalorhabdaceae bacterium]
TAMQGLVVSAKEWRTWMLVILYFTTFGGFLALTAWFPTYWSELHGLEGRMAGVMTASFSLLASAIRVPGGTWADRLGGEKVAAASLGTLLLGAVVLTLTTNFYFALVAELLVGIGMGVNNAAVFKMVPHYVHHAVGGAAGWVGGLGAFGGFVVPPLLGKFVDMEGDIGYAHGFVVYIGLALVCLAVAGVLRMTYSDQEHEQAA